MSAVIDFFCSCSKQRHNKLWQPDADCEMAEGPTGGSSQPCGGEEGVPLTPELQPEGVSLDMDPGTSLDVDPAPLCRPSVSLDVDPAYNHYYFRRLSDSALDSEPSTPSRRGPPLEGLEKVFIQVEDVERDALLDEEDQDHDQDQDIPLNQGGNQALEELRLRLEFSTVEEQKDEAEMEVLMQPDASSGKGGGDCEESEGNGMDLATLNENCNNNKCLAAPRNHQVTYQ